MTNKAMAQLDRITKWSDEIKTYTIVVYEGIVVGFAYLTADLMFVLISFLNVFLPLSAAFRCV